MTRSDLLADSLADSLADLRGRPPLLPIGRPADRWAGLLLGLLGPGLLVLGLCGCRSGGLERLGMRPADYTDLRARDDRLRQMAERQPGRQPAGGPPTARRRPARNGGRPVGARRTRGRGAAGRVFLSDADLAPVDAYLRAGNAQWILGDTVEVYASKEYFSSALTLNAKIGLVHRRDEKSGDVEISTLTFIGYKTQRSAMVNPRALIGTGLTVTARKVLRVRMFPAKDPNRPVRLRVVAQGNASRGRKERVLERGPTLQLGGTLQRVGSGYVWNALK